MDNKVLTRNKKLALFFSATHQVAIISPVWVIFGSDHLHLSLTQSLILGYMALATSAFFEIPMGAFADKFGRKATLITGLGLTAFGDLTLILFNNFILLMFLQIFAGLGWAMRTGSLEGLLHDTFEAYGDKTSYSKLSGKMLTLSSVSRVFTVPLGAYLYTLNPEAKISSYTYPYIGEIIFFCIAIICVYFLVESRSSRSDKHRLDGESLEAKVSVTKHILMTWKEMRANSDIKKVLTLLCFYALLGEGNWSLYQQYFRDRGIKVTDSGWVYSAIFIVMAIGAFFVSRVYEKINVVWAMNIIVYVVVVGIVLMHMALPIAIIGFMINALVGPMCFHLHDNAIQNRMNGERKSTALSIASMGYTIGSVIGTIGVGAVADSYGVLAAQWIFVAIGLFIFVVVGLSSISEGFGVLSIDRIASEKPIIDLVELEAQGDLGERSDELVDPVVLQDLDDPNASEGPNVISSSVTDTKVSDGVEDLQDLDGLQGSVIDLTEKPKETDVSESEAPVEALGEVPGEVPAEAAKEAATVAVPVAVATETQKDADESDSNEVSNFMNVAGIQNAIIDSKRF